MADKKISELTSATTPLAGTEVLPIVQSNSTVKVAVSNLTAGRNVSLAGLTATGATQKLGAVTQTDITVQIGPDTPITTSSSRILFNTASDRKNWFINHNWNLAGGLSFAQSTVAGGSTMAADSHQWDLNGNYKIVNGNVVIGTAGKGIDFSAAGNAAGMTSELLADYEEGTWTPVIAGSVTPGTYDLASSLATYTKIGRQVTVSALITTASSLPGGGTGDFIITGLPFSKSANQRAFAAVAIGGMNYTSGGVVFASFGTSGESATLYFSLSVSNTGVTLLPISLVGASNFIGFTLSYNA